MVIPPVGVHLAGIHVTTAEHRIHVGQPCPAERQCHRDSDQLGGLWLDIPVERGRTRHRRHRAGTSEFLQLGPALFPEHAHQRQDEVRIVERDPLAVNAKDVGHLLDRDVGFQGDDLEVIALEVVQPLDGVSQPVLLGIIKYAAVSIGQPGQELSLGVPPVPRLPQSANVGDELRVLLDRRTRHLERPVGWAERQADPQA